MKEHEVLKIFSDHLDKWFICYDKKDFEKELFWKYDMSYETAFPIKPHALFRVSFGPIPASCAREHSTVESQHLKASLGL